VASALQKAASAVWRAERLGFEIIEDIQAVVAKGLDFLSECRVRVGLEPCGGAVRILFRNGNEAVLDRVIVDIELSRG